MRIQTAALLAVMIGAFIQARAEKFDTKKLEGTYTVVSGQRDGKAIPDAEIKGSMITFTKDRVTGTDKDKKEFYAASYTIDDGTKPYTIRMTSITPKKGEKAGGVIEIDGDTVRVCYNLPGGKAPRNFDAGEKQHCFVLKKMK